MQNGGDSRFQQQLYVIDMGCIEDAYIKCINHGMYFCCYCFCGNQDEQDHLLCFLDGDYQLIWQIRDILQIPLYAIYAISVAANNLSYFLKYQFSTEKFNHDNSVYVHNNYMRKCIQLSIFSSKTYSYFIFEKSVQEHVYSIYQYYWIGFRYGHVCQFTDKFLTLLHVLCTCVRLTNPLYKF